MNDFLQDNLTHIITFVVTILLTFMIARIARKAFGKFLLKIEANQELDKTNYYFLRYVLIAIIYGVGFTLAIYTVPAFRAIGTTLLAGAGVLALAISFASQQALSNVVSGLFIVIFKPFKIKDHISLNSADMHGIIEDITLRHTVIRNYENKRIIVPNSVISNEIITNSDYIDGKICKHLDFGISYESSIAKARDIIRSEVMKHPLSIDNRKPYQINAGEEQVIVRTINLGDSSVDLRTFVWTNNQDSARIMTSDLLESVKNRFDEEGIDIPYPHRTVYFSNKLQTSS